MEAKKSKIIKNEPVERVWLTSCISIVFMCCWIAGWLDGWLRRWCSAACIVSSKCAFSFDSSLWFFSRSVAFVPQMHEKKEPKRKRKVDDWADEPTKIRRTTQWKVFGEEVESKLLMHFWDFLQNYIPATSTSWSGTLRFFLSRLLVLSIIDCERYFT